jgi:enamine deaminase RidA (YjgF/YER057c/UK114 family)
MTRVRLEYGPDPGPAATAVRVAGLPVSGCMIQIEGIAHFPDNIANRLRIMPADSWDWSIPVPLSQGWQIGGTVYVGGQISADKKGRAVALGDVGKQTDNVLDFIDRVVEEGGGSPSDIVALKVCYAAGESGEHGRTLLANILQNAQRRLDLTKIALTAFAVDLLYEGLLLEIDAAAEISGAKRALSTGLKPCSDVAGACSGMIAGNQIYLAGRVSAKAPSSTEVSETERVKKQLADILRGFKVDLDQAGSSLPDVAKLNLFIVGDGDTEALMRSLKAISGVITDYFGSKAPAVTIVRVNGLPHADAVIQADCVAIISS